MLTTEQYNNLKPKEKKKLRVDWDDPVTLPDAVGGIKAKMTKNLIPPPSIYLVCSISNLQMMTPLKTWRIGIS